MLEKAKTNCAHREHNALGKGHIDYVTQRVRQNVNENSGRNSAKISETEYSHMRVGTHKTAGSDNSHLHSPRGSFWV